MNGGPLMRMRFIREHLWTRSHLSAYLDEDLPTRGHSRLDEHLHACRECRRLLQGLRRAIEGMRAMRAAAPALPGGTDISDSIIERLRDEA